MAHRELLDLVDSVMDKYFEMCRDAEGAREEETAAAVVLQSAWRGQLQRTWLRDFENRAVAIQRHWRGHVGRRQAAAAREARDRQEREAYFRAAATTIQRHWRGYWSRKHLHSLAARRAYLAAASQASAAAKRAMDEECARTIEAANAGRAATALEAFQRQVARLHHLASTQAVPGIFSPPFEVAAGLVPVVDGLTIEEHLQRASKLQVAPEVQQRLREAGQLQPRVPPEQASPTARLLLRPKVPAAPAVADKQGARSSRGTLAAAPGTKGRLAPVVAGVGPAATTLRQAAPYDAVRESLALERCVDKAQIVVLHNRPFFGPSAVVKEPFRQPTIRGADAFQDLVVGGIPGARGAHVGMGGAAAARAAAVAAGSGAICGATGRLFDASGHIKAFFDSSLREGY